jgi:hypothetical protein
MEGAGVVYKEGGCWLLKPKYYKNLLSTSSQRALTALHSSFSRRCFHLANGTHYHVGGGYSQPSSHPP